MTVSPDEIGRLLHWIPIILRAYGVSDKTREFCASIEAQKRRPGFRPSPKQAAVMREIVDAYVRSTLSAEPAAGPDEADLLSLIESPPENPLHPHERNGHGAG
jgi:hypothetical protein